MAEFLPSLWALFYLLLLALFFLMEILCSKFYFNLILLILQLRYDSIWTGDTPSAIPRKCPYVIITPEELRMGVAFHQLMWTSSQQHSKIFWMTF